MTNIYKHQEHPGKRDLPNKLNKTAVADPGMTEICDLSDREFKIAVLKKLNKLQENTEKKKIRILSQKFKKDIEIIFKNQAETLELKYSINKLKNTSEIFATELIKQKKEFVNLKIGYLKIHRRDKRKKNKKQGSMPTGSGKYPQKGKSKSYWP